MDGSAIFSPTIGFLLHLDGPGKVVGNSFFLPSSDKSMIEEERGPLPARAIFLFEGREKIPPRRIKGRKVSDSKLIFPDEIETR